MLAAMRRAFLAAPALGEFAQLWQLGKVRQGTLAAASTTASIARDNSWIVVSALFASMFDDYTMEWLNRRGYLRWDRRGEGEAIISAVNALIAHHR